MKNLCFILLLFLCFIAKSTNILNNWGIDRVDIKYIDLGTFKEATSCEEFDNNTIADYYTTIVNPREISHLLKILINIDSTESCPACIYIYNRYT